MSMDDLIRAFEGQDLIKDEMLNEFLCKLSSIPHLMAEFTVKRSVDGISANL